jgi:hypothetical protein
LHWVPDDSLGDDDEQKEPNDVVNDVHDSSRYGLQSTAPHESEQNDAMPDEARKGVTNKGTASTSGTSYVDWRERPAENDDDDTKDLDASDSDGTDSEAEVEALIVEDEDAEEPVYQGKMKLAIKDKFHSYVRPVWQPKLSTFCKSLTGISQVRC